VARIDVRTFIRATPERVWEVISDLSGQARWMVDVRQLKITSQTKSGVGTVIDLKTELFGLPILHDVIEIVTWEPARELGIVHRGQFSGTASFQLQPFRDGTIFTWLEEYKPPLGPVGELAHELLIRPHMQRVFGRSMDNVRRLAEQPGPELEGDGP
jgi:uncharacterized protein YndB with AHSA1/START domain